MGKKLKYILVVASVIFILILIWQGIAFLVNAPKIFPDLSYLYFHSLPSFSNFSESFSQNNNSSAFKVLTDNTFYTLLRIFQGSLYGFVAGFGYGFMIHFFSNYRHGNLMILKLLRSIPLLALVPLFLYWFGTTENGMIVFIAFSVFIIIATNTYQAVLNVPYNLIEQGKLYGSTKLQIYFDIILPSIVGELLGGIKYVFGLLWAISLAAEYLSASNGLGFLVSQSYLFADMGKLIILCFIYCLLSLITYYLINLIVQKKFKWINN